MAEVTETGHDHCHAVGTAIINRLVVADRAAGLYHIVDTCFMRDFHAVAEGEEGVRGHGGSVEVEVEIVSLLDCLLESVYTRCLSYTRSDELAIAGKHYGVALAVLDELVGEEHVGDLLLAEAVAGYETEVVGTLYLVVAVLNEHAPEDGAHAFAGRKHFFAAQDNAVFLLLKYCQSVVAVVGGDDYLKENLAHFFGCVGLYFGIGDDYAAATVPRLAHPQALLCLSTATVVVSNSSIRAHAASMSRRLL